MFKADLFYFLFQIYPYVCFAVFIVGTLLRYERAQYGWRAGSSEILRKKSLMWGSTLFHVGVILLLMGHFVGLLTPEWLYNSMGLSTAHKQMLAITAGSIFGSLTFVGLTILMIRRFTDPRIRKNSRFSDDFIVVLLWVQLCLGLSTIPISLHYPDGSHMVELANWVQHIVTFRPGAVQFLTGVQWPYLVHLVIGMTLFLVFPFTRLVHVISAPVMYMFRPGYQIVRRRAFSIFRK